MKTLQESLNEAITGPYKTVLDIIHSLFKKDTVTGIPEVCKTISPEPGILNPVLVDEGIEIDGRVTITKRTPIPGWRFDDFRNGRYLLGIIYRGYPFTLGVVDMGQYVDICIYQGTRQLRPLDSFDKYVSECIYQGTRQLRPIGVPSIASTSM